MNVYIDNFDFILVFICYYCYYYYYFSSSSYYYYDYYHNQRYGIATQFRALDSSIFLPHIFRCNANFSDPAVRTTSLHQVFPSVLWLPYWSTTIYLYFAF